MMTGTRFLLLCTVLGLNSSCRPPTTAPPAPASLSSAAPAASAMASAVAPRERPPLADRNKQTPFPPVQSTLLHNGVSIDVIERRNTPVVDLSLVVASGHAEDEEHPGAARLMALLLEAGGAGPWSSEKLREAVDALGSSLQVASTRDTMRWSLAVTSDKVEQALDILGALAQKPHFAPDEFKKLKARELERVRSLAKTSGAWLAQYWLNRELYQLVMGIHPYASVDVLPSEVGRLTLEDCRRFFKRHLVPSNTRLMAVGDIGLPQFTNSVERRFGRWRGSEAPDPTIVEPLAGDGLRVFVVDRPGSAQSDIQLGVLGPARNSADFPAILTIQQVVGGGVAGRLFQDVREKRSLAYATYAGIQEVAAGPSILSFSAGTQTAKTSEAVAALIEHLERVKDEPSSFNELETAQNYIIYGMPARWETVESLSSQLLLLKTHGQSERYFDELREHVSSLSTPVLKVPAARYYQRQRAVIVVAGDAVAVAEGLRQFGTVEVLDPEREFSVKRKLPAL